MGMIKSKTEYRLLSYVRDNPGADLRSLQFGNIASSQGHPKYVSHLVIRKGLMTVPGGRCFLTEEGKEVLERYEEYTQPCRRGIVEHRHEGEKIKSVSEN